MLAKDTRYRGARCPLLEKISTATLLIVDDPPKDHPRSTSGKGAGPHD